MGQLGFFDLSGRYEGLDRKKDPLVTLAAVVPWESFRCEIQAALARQNLRTAAAVRRSAAGRKPWDAVLIFKTLVVQALYNLSDEQMEYQLRDRLSFMRFLGLGLEDAVPDATTLWLYREALARDGTVETLFATFDCYLRDQGLLAMGGRLSTPPSSRHRSSVTTAAKTTPSSRARRRPGGTHNRPGGGRKIPTPAGPRSMGGRTTATRTTSAWIAGTNWCGAIQ